MVVLGRANYSHKGEEGKAEAIRSAAMSKLPVKVLVDAIGES